MSAERRGRRASALRSRQSTGGLEDLQGDEGRRTCLGGGATPLAGGGGIFKSAAVAVLRQERKLMTTGEITKLALDRQLIKCQGKTPEATMASALYTDVKRKHDKSVFTRPQEGLFGLREWIDEGYFPDNWVGPKDGLCTGVAPFKKRTASAKMRHPPGRSSKLRASNVWRGDSGSDYEGEDYEYDAEGFHGDGSYGEGEDDYEYDNAGEHEYDDEGEGEYDEGEGMPEDDQPTPSSYRAQHSSGKRGRPSSMRGDRSGNPLDDEDSPLHVLGEVAQAERDREEGGKRRRPQHRVSVPDGHGHGHGHGHGEFANPKSPYEDTLAALHEIATSPGTYAPNGVLDFQVPRESRRRPRHLMVDVPPHGDEPPVTSMGLPSMSTPSSLFHGLDTPNLPPMHDSATGPVLLAASPLAGANGQVMLVRPAPLMLSVPGLTSPNSAYLSLDTPATQLLTMPLPDSLPGATPDLLAAMQGINPHGHHSLLSPNGLLPMFTPRQGLAGLVKGNGMASAAALLQSRPQAQQQQTASGLADLAEIGRVQAVVERLEAKLGSSSPQVGKAWLALARMYQHVGAASNSTVSMESAANALQRAYSICRGCADVCGYKLKCDSAFRYLQEQLTTAAASNGGGEGPAGEDAAPTKQES